MGNACREAFGGESQKLKAGDVSKVLARMDDSIDWSEFVATCGLTGPDGMVEFDSFLEFVYSSKAPPNASKVIFKAEFDAWWKQAGPKLFATITTTKDTIDGERIKDITTCGSLKGGSTTCCFAPSKVPLHRILALRVCSRH